MIEPISFVVPRKVSQESFLPLLSRNSPIPLIQSDAFQSDLFPPAPSDQPALSGSDWFGGKTAPPILIDMQTRQTATSSDPTYKTYTPSTSKPAPTPTPAKSTPPPVAAEPKSEPTPPRQPSPPPRQMTPPPPPVAATPAPEPTRAATNGNSSSSTPPNNEELDSLRQENSELKSALSEKDSIIRELELKLEKIKAAFS